MTSSPSLQAFGKRVLHIQHALSWLLGQSRRRLADARASRGLSLGGSFDVPTIAYRYVNGNPSLVLGLNAFPILSAYNLTNSFPTNGIKAAYGQVGHSRSVFGPNFQNFIFSQFPITDCISAFIIAVNHIVERSSCKQVRISNAWWIIAMMAEEFLTRIGMSSQLPCHSMRSHMLFADNKKAITRFVQEASVNPTWTKFRAMFWNRSIFIDPRPESISQLFRRTFEIIAAFYGTELSCCCKEGIEHAFAI